MSLKLTKKKKKGIVRQTSATPLPISLQPMDTAPSTGWGIFDTPEGYQFIGYRDSENTIGILSATLPQDTTQITGRVECHRVPSASFIGWRKFA
jgi:hypothetical protein